MEKSKFNELVSNLEKNKEAIIFEKISIEKEKKRKRKKYSKKIDVDVEIFKDKVEYFFGKDLFIFDKEGYDLFEEKFDTFRSKIIVYNGYLCKLVPKIKKPFRFHRWLMSEEIKEFAKNNQIENLKDIHIHHIDCDPKNNRKDNLQVMTNSAHKKLHNKLNRQI